MAAVLRSALFMGLLALPGCRPPAPPPAAPAPPLVYVDASRYLSLHPAGPELGALDREIARLGAPPRTGPAGGLGHPDIPPAAELPLPEPPAPGASPELDADAERVRRETLGDSTVSRLARANQTEEQYQARLARLRRRYEQLREEPPPVAEDALVEQDRERAEERRRLEQAAAAARERPGDRLRYSRAELQARRERYREILQELDQRFGPVIGWRDDPVFNAEKRRLEEQLRELAETPEDKKYSAGERRRRRERFEQTRTQLQTLIQAREERDDLASALRQGSVSRLQEALSAPAHRPPLLPPDLLRQAQREGEAERTKTLQSVRALLAQPAAPGDALRRRALRELEELILQARKEREAERLAAEGSAHERAARAAGATLPAPVPASVPQPAADVPPTLLAAREEMAGVVQAAGENAPQLLPERTGRTAALAGLKARRDSLRRSLVEHLRVVATAAGRRRGLRVTFTPGRAPDRTASLLPTVRELLEVGQ